MASTESREPVDAAEGTEREGCVLGVDLGGTKTAVSLWCGDRRVAREVWATPVGPDATIARVTEAGRRLADAESMPIAAIGISGGGPLDPVRGVVLSVPNLPGWHDVPIVERLSEALGAPAALENDANASALAEWRYGAGRGVDDMAFLTCSTGIGAGLILDGRLYRGSRFLAGEVGHHVIVPEGAPCGCGARGCLEAYASGAGIARRLAERRPLRPDLPGSAKELVERAREGHRGSISFLEETAVFLARGLANLVFMLDPRRIVLGTIAVGAGPLLLDPLRRELDRLLWPQLAEGLEVVPAQLGADLGDQAARAVAETLFRPGPGR